MQFVELIIITFDGKRNPVYFIKICTEIIFYHNLHISIIWIVPIWFFLQKKLS